MEGFDARKAFFDMLEDAIELGYGLQVPVERDELTDLLSYSTNRFPGYIGVHLVDL